MGMELARIDSYKEYVWAFWIFGAYFPWIGVNDRDREGSFANVGGCPLQFTLWNYGRPNDRNNQGLRSYVGTEKLE